MNVLIVTKEAPSTYGGIYRRVTGLIRSIGTACNVAVAFPAGSGAESFRLAGARTAFPLRELEDIPIVNHAMISSALLRAAREHRADLIHLAQGSLAFAAESFDAEGIPCVVTLHAEEIARLSDLDDPGSALAALVRGLRRSRGVAVTSRGMIETARRLGPADSPVLLPPAIDTGRFVPGDRAAARERLRLPADRTILLSIGNADRPDGFLTMIDALRHLSSWNPQLVIAGDGRMQRRIAARAAFLGISDRVSIGGDVPEETLPDLYRAADLFLSPSHASIPLEEFSDAGPQTAFLEAAACGIAGVAAPEDLDAVIESTPEVHAGNDAEALAAAVDRLLSDAGLRAGLVEAARVTIEEHCSDRRVGEVAIGWYTRILTEPAHRTAVHDEPAASISVRRRARSGSVAVVLPSHGCRAWLERAIVSIERQSWPEVELYVIDDASGDVDDALIERHPEATFLRTREQLGPFGITNLIVAMTGSDYVAIQDADDWSHPDRFAEQIAFLEERALDGCGSWCLTVDINGDPLGFETWPEYPTAELRRPEGHAVVHGSTLYRRRVFDRLRGFDGSTRFGADAEFLWRACHAVELGNVQRFLYYRMVRPDSLTQDLRTGLASAARARYVERVVSATTAIAAGAPPPADGLLLSGEPVVIPDRSIFATLHRGTGNTAFLYDR
jgi:glycosyltransferase involved in cell wall biosynthesis